MVRHRLLTKISLTLTWHHSNMYFSNFKPVLVDFSQYGELPKQYLVSDLLQNVRLKTELLNNLVYYEEFDINDGDTPEIISEMFYGTPMYHWIIMLVNERYDYINDFPMIPASLEVYIVEKYGANNVDNIHHYVTADGYVVNSDYINAQGLADALPVTNYEHEFQQNETKRRIKMIPPAALADVLTQFREIMK
jgi:hypothetical protein